ncbi:retrovirus-related pol polyprotein from transposon TNT 1-94 [Tanacetum coccineum]
MEKVYLNHNHVRLDLSIGLATMKLIGPNGLHLGRARVLSLIRKRHNKTPYELLHDRKPDLSYLYVFGALFYPTNDGEDIGKLKSKADIGIFVGYAPVKKTFLIYNKRTQMTIETIHVDFDELTAMASEQFSSGSRPKLLTPGTISSGLVPNILSSTLYVPPTKNN